MKVYVCDYCETKLGEIACGNSLGGSYCSPNCADRAEYKSRKKEEAAVELTANDIRWQPDRVIDLLANLARRVSSLEQQLADTQNNLVRQGEELEAVRYGNDEMYLRLKGVEERTANHRDELNVIDHEKAMIFEDIVSLSKRIKKLNGGAAE